MISNNSNLPIVVTVIGIRPDIIRLSEVIKKLDASPHLKHVIIHTGQHYDKNLSDVFFKDLNVREPDFNLQCGRDGISQTQLSSDISLQLVTALNRINNVIGKVKLVVYLGDSNSVCSAVNVKKEGYKICHIEAGMRSFDNRMFEEINRIVIDHCSDLLFTYHDNYSQNLIDYGIHDVKIVNVGNTIVEVIKNIEIPPFLHTAKGHVIIDIHRPENFKDTKRLCNLFNFTSSFYWSKQTPVLNFYFLKFKRTMEAINNAGLKFPDYIIPIELMGFKDYIGLQKSAYCIISDSGTAQEEAPLLNVPVLVPRDFTERPESYTNNCSFKLNLNKLSKNQEYYISNFIYNYNMNSYFHNTKWLGTGKTSSKIVKEIEKFIK